MARNRNQQTIERMPQPGLDNLDHRPDPPRPSEGEVRRLRRSLKQFDRGLKGGHDPTPDKPIRGIHF